jgi:hypothetical protein
MSVKALEIEFAAPSLMVAVIVTRESARTHGGALHVKELLVPVSDWASREPVENAQEKVSSLDSAS